MNIKEEIITASELFDCMKFSGGENRGNNKVKGAYGCALVCGLACALHSGESVFFVRSIS